MSNLQSKNDEKSDKRILLFRDGLTKTQEFENKFASVLNVKFALGVSSGLAALHVALLACGVKAGDEVLVDPLFKYGAMATIQCNAIPIFYDVSMENYMPEIRDVQEKMSPKTRAIVITNVFGCTPKLKEIRTFCNETGIFLIEDCAQTLKCKCEDKYAGTYGDFGVFSFYSTTHFSLGDGGALVTNNEYMYKKALIIHDENIEAQMCFDDDYCLRYSYRMPELVSKAALLKLDCLDGLILYHKGIGEYISEALCTRNFILQKNEYSEHVYWKVGFLTNDEELYCHLEKKFKNNNFVEFGLNNKKVVPEFPLFKNFGRKDRFNCPYDCIFAAENSKREARVVNANRIVNHLMSIKIEYGLSINHYKEFIHKI